MLQLTDSIENLGGLRWQLVITLALAWICVFFCLFKGVGVLGKVLHSFIPFSIDFILLSGNSSGGKPTIKPVK